MINSTRLRSITASDSDTLEAAVNALPFKIEIKEIIKDKTTYKIFFVLPEQDGLVWESVDLT